jgi:hypothetical protein
MRATDEKDVRCTGRGQVGDSFVSKERIGILVVVGLHGGV